MVFSPFGSSNDAQNVPSNPSKAHSLPISFVNILQFSGASKLEQSKSLKPSNLVVSPKTRGKLSAWCSVSYRCNLGKTCMCPSVLKWGCIRTPSTRILPKRKSSTPKASQLADVKSVEAQDVTRSMPSRHSCLFSGTDARVSVIDDRSKALEMPFIERMLIKRWKYEYISELKGDEELYEAKI